MATVGLMAVEVRVLDLAFGRIDITKLRLSDVELLLETDAQGRGNWQRIGRGRVKDDYGRGVR